MREPRSRSAMRNSSQERPGSSVSARSRSTRSWPGPPRVSSSTRQAGKERRGVDRGDAEVLQVVQPPAQTDEVAAVELVHRLEC